MSRIMFERLRADSCCALLTRVFFVRMHVSISVSPVADADRVKTWLLP